MFKSLQLIIKEEKYSVQLLNIGLKIK